MPLFRRLTLILVLLCLQFPAWAQSNRLDEVLARGTLRVGTTGDYKPFSYRPAGSDTFIGLDVELAGRPIRVCAVSPGMVHTDEFSLVRFGGDQARADAVYAGVAEPLVATDIAEAVRWISTLPEHVNIDRLVIRPRAQASIINDSRSARRRGASTSYSSSRVL